jgi:hypothetical protein
MVRDLSNGGWQARCPACAEAGQDRKGEHLRISPEGKFGCCVFAGDPEHRKRIFALAGDHGPKTINVRVAAAKSAGSVQVDLLGRLGRLFSSAEPKMKNAECATEETAKEIRTLRTLVSDPRAYANEPVNNDLFIHKLIECEEPVLSVLKNDSPIGEVGGTRLPYLLSDGTLVIPFDSPERYHWWKRGQAISATLMEIRNSKFEIRKEH